MDLVKKEARYKRIYSQLSDLLKKSDDSLAHKATISAVLFNKMDYFFWCGFYRVETDYLVVENYQGSVACQLLQNNKGVCWAAVIQNKTIIVPNVETFPNHIACDSRSKSEIVVPLRNSSGIITAVLDVDSKYLNSFDEVDAEYLEMIVELIKKDN
ncbi:MAG: GAF domain-containing protein [Bacteroidota bacterium]